MLTGYLENAFVWDGLLQNGLFHVSGKIVVAGPTFLWPTELLMAGLFIVILFGIFLLGSAVVHRFDKREMSLVENQLRAIRVVEAQLAERTKDLERSNRDLAQFAYVASHDLRAPVRAMKSFAQILVQDYTGKLDAEADEHLEFIVNGANRLESLINDLLAYSRIDSRGKDFGPVDCSVVFDQVRTDLLIDTDHGDDRRHDKECKSDHRGLLSTNCVRRRCEDRRGHGSRLLPSILTAYRRAPPAPEVNSPANR